MAEVTPGRRAALEVLSRVRDGDIADRALARFAGRLDPRELAWTHELVFGTLRLRGRLDHLLGKFVRVGLDALDPVVLDVLRLAAYQLVEMASVPPYAAVSQSVDLVRVAGAGRAAGLVNAVLQAFGRGWKNVRFPDPATQPLDFLVTWGSHPRWLVERWIARYGPESTRLLVEANNRRPELYLTPIGPSVAETIDRLRESGISADTVERFPDSLIVLPPAGPTEALRVVRAVVQDPAAAAVVRFADFGGSDTVIDLAAAPGGKTAGFTGRANYVIASDLSLGRLRRVRSNVERLQLEERVGLVVADGRRPPFRPVPAVLVDAPCTGTGTLRRHADGRWRITPADLDALVQLQWEILNAAAELVASGGTLVYATCSLEPEENELQVQRFLATNPEFRLRAPREPIDGTILVGDFLSILPQRHGVDGAFAARLERVM